MLALKNNASLEVVDMLLNTKANKIKKLIGKKVDLNKRSKNGETALMIAFEKKLDDKIIMQLLMIYVYNVKNLYIKLFCKCM